MSNQLELVVIIRSPARWTTWERALADLPGVQIVHGPATDIVPTYSLDAEVFPGVLAYERLRGNPATGISHILSTRGQTGMPPWVVTFPTFRVEQTQDGPMWVTWHPAHGPDDIEYLYRGFLEVLETVGRFNEKRTAKIRRLGLPEDSVFYGYDPALAADAVRRAYLDWAAHHAE